MNDFFFPNSRFIFTVSLLALVMKTCLWMSGWMKKWGADKWRKTHFNEMMYIEWTQWFNIESPIYIVTFYFLFSTFYLLLMKSAMFQHSFYSASQIDDRNLTKENLPSSFDNITNNRKENIGNNFVTVRTVRPWNNLPESVKGQKTTNAFKSAYDRWKQTQTQDSKKTSTKKPAARSPIWETNLSSGITTQLN